MGDGSAGSPVNFLILLDVNRHLCYVVSLIRWICNLDQFPAESRLFRPGLDGEGKWIGFGPAGEFTERVIEARGTKTCPFMSINAANAGNRFSG
jgi:hypothetical protein